MSDYDVVPDHDQYIRLLSAAKKRFPRRRNLLLHNQIWSHMMKCASENQHITDERELKALVKARVENKMASSGTFVSILIWWILPTLVEFFVKWWLDDLSKQRDTV